MSDSSFINNYKKIWYASEKTGGERNFFDYFIYRRLSTLILMGIKELDFSPNVITSLSICFSIFAGLCFLYTMNGPVYYIGILLMMISLVFDTLDGQYARFKGKQSEFGGWYDAISDSFKYIVLFLCLSIGFYYHLDYESQWFINEILLFEKNREMILILGLFIISNFYMVYLIHTTRYKLTINPDTVVNISVGDKKYFFGIESTLYTIFAVFLLAEQVIWLFILLSFLLPFAWIYPFYLTYAKYNESAL